MGMGQMNVYTVIYERGKEGEENWGAYIPDLPGCVSMGETFDEVQENIREVHQEHIDLLREQGMPIPEPSCRAGMVDVAA
jgi:predicted RNase H-like HicB family nuclease